MKKIYYPLSLSLLVLAGCTKEKLIFDYYSTMRYDVLRLPTVADTLALRTVDFVSATQGFVGGEQGALFTTTDAGQTWTRLPSLGASTVNKLLFTSATNGWAGTETGLYRTTNGGQRWTLVPTYNSYGSSSLTITDVQFVTPLVGYAVGAAGVINKTTNGGGTWTSIQSLRHKVYPFRAVSFSSVDSGTVVGDEYAQWTTTNGGLTWRFVDGAPSGAGVDRQFDVLRFNETSYLLALPGGLSAYAPGYSYGQRPDDGFGFPAYGLATAGPRGPVVAVGERTLIRQRAATAAPDSAPWVYVHRPDGTSFVETFYAADFAESSTFYAVGARGIIYRFHYL